MRDDSLSRALDERRWPGPVARQPSRRGLSRTTGRDVAARYGLVAHYMSSSVLPTAMALGWIGGPGGTWLSPTPYAGCLVSYDLGLNTPRDLCILVDVSAFDEVWGPGTAEASTLHSTIWRGGGIEFFVPGPISIDHVREVIRLSPCGDTH